MAECRRSAHAIDDQNNGGTVSAKNHVTRNPVIYIDQCPARALHRQKKKVNIKVHNVPRAPMDSDGNSRLSIQKVARPSGTNLQLAAETCEFH